MTPEQQEKCDLIATELMGWKKKFAFGSDLYAYFLNNQFIAWTDSWNPFKDWSDCGRVLDRLDELNLNHAHERVALQDYEFCINNAGWERFVGAYAQDLKSAVCLAVLELITKHPEVLR